MLDLNGWVRRHIAKKESTGPNNVARESKEEDREKWEKWHCSYGKGRQKWESCPSTALLKQREGQALMWFQRARKGHGSRGPLSSFRNPPRLSITVDEMMNNEMMRRLISNIPNVYKQGCSTHCYPKPYWFSPLWHLTALKSNMKCSSNHISCVFIIFLTRKLFPNSLCTSYIPGMWLFILKMIFLN